MTDIQAEVRALSLKPGDVIVIKTDDDSETLMDAVEELAKEVGHFVIILPTDKEIFALSRSDIETMLREYEEPTRGE